MDADEGLTRLRALGFGEADAQELCRPLRRRGEPRQAGTRPRPVPWLEALDGLDPRREPARGRQRRRGSSAGTAAARSATSCSGASCDAQLERPPVHARLVVCERTFPTGMLGHWRAPARRRRARRACSTATSPRRLGIRPAGRSSQARIRSRSGSRARRRPVVVDVSMGAVTWATSRGPGRGGGARALRRRAGAQGVRARARPAAPRRCARAREGHGAVLLVARPEADPVPALRELAAGVRLPGDSQAGPG